MTTLKKILAFFFIIYSFFTNAKIDFQEVTGSPFSTGRHPASVAFSPEVSGKLFAAAANSDDYNISTYSVNVSTGTFSEASGSPITTGSLPPRCITFSPLISENLFAATANHENGNSSISVYSVDTLTGSFTSVSGSPFSAGSSPASIAFSPLTSGGLFAAVANYLSAGSLSVYSVNGSTGAFTEISGSPFSAGSNPISVSYSPQVSRKLFAAVANFNSSNVSVYSVNESTGALTEVVGSPFSTGSSPVSISFSPEVSGGLFAAVANFNSSNVSVYSVDSSGIFTPLQARRFLRLHNPLL